MRREADQRFAWSKWKKIRSAVKIPPLCQSCSASFSKIQFDGRKLKPHAHHLDYTRPYDVEWLCPGCHMRKHRDEILAVRGYWPE
jgi:hypothetical protein